MKDSIYPSAGWSLGPPFVCNPLALNGVTVAVPWYDYATQTVQTRDVTVRYTVDYDYDGSGSFADELFRVLDDIWRDTLNFFQLACIPDPNLATVFTFDENGIDLDIGGAIAAAEVDFDIVGSSVDYWWGTSDFAKLGVLNWKDSTTLYREPHKWVNSKSTFHYAEKPAQGLRLLVQPGCSGHGIAYGKMTAPSLTYTGASSGTYP